MKVCFFSTYSTKDYVRQKVFLEGLKLNNVELFEIRKHGNNPLRYLKALARLFLNRKKFDVVLVNFRGHEMMPFVPLLSGKPVVYDAFISAYNTVCEDHGMFGINSLPCKFLFWLDKHNCMKADAVLLDGKAHKEYFTETFGIEGDKIKVLYLGADSVFAEAKGRENKKNTFNVLWYGSYLPLHGMEHCIEAAGLLRNESKVKFTFIGRGDAQKKLREKAQMEGLSNIEFIEWVPYGRLPEYMAAADVCLTGPFGTTKKAELVVLGKTYQCMAMRRPVIAGKCRANDEILHHMEDSVLVERGSGKAIADAIIMLKNNRQLREKIAEGAYRNFSGNFSAKEIGRQLMEILLASASPRVK